MTFKVMYTNTCRNLEEGVSVIKTSASLKEVQEAVIKTESCIRFVIEGDIQRARARIDEADSDDGDWGETEDED